MFQRFNQTFNDLDLGRKFNFVMLAIFCLGIILTSGLFWGIQTNAAKQDVTDRALILMQTMNSVRSYTSEHVKPELAKQQAIQDEFISETVPAFAATSVFSYFNETPEYDSFNYREATLNPTNPNDKADRFETSIINYLRDRSDVTETEGFRNTSDGKQFYIARPLKVSKESCLECHSTPQRAPASLVSTYGSENGFGWELDEVVGAQIISVPSGEVFNRAGKSVLVLMIATAGMFAITIYSINVLLNRAVVDRLISLSLIADQMSKGIVNVDFDVTSKDEIGRLGVAFNRLRQKFISALKHIQQNQK